MVLGLVCFGEGRWEEATRYLEDSIVVGKIGPRPHTWALFAPRALTERDLLEGQPERARDRLAPLLDTADRDEVDVSLLWPPYAWAHLDLGDVVTAAAIVGRAITQARAQNDRLTLVAALRVQALVALRRERWAEGEQALEEGLALARAMPYPYAEARLLHVYGEMYVAKGEPIRGQERLLAALAIFQRLGARKDAEHVTQSMADLSLRA
jgi:tetratricopeptide (TPR) repeat protein